MSTTTTAKETMPHLAPTACALTPDQAKKWGETRAALSWHCPAFTHVFYTMLNTVKSEHVALFTKDVPIAATDGSSLIINPDTFFKFDLNQRVFICAHEILHCIWNHCGALHDWVLRGKVNYPDGTSLPYIHELMNIAMDLVINDLLIEAGKENGQSCGQPIPNIYHDPKIATGKDSVIDAYKKVFDEKKRNGQIQGISFDQHLAPGATQGKDPNQAKQDRDESQWKTEAAAGATIARLQGKMPAALDRFFKELLNPQIDWRERIKALFARKVGSGTYNWRRPHPRLIARDIFAPSTSGFGAECVVVAGDTSGSIDYEKGANRRASTGDMFFAEIAGILEEVRPKRLVILWCDAKVHNVDEADEPSDLNTIRRRGVGGGGGTSFIPVFDKIKQMGLEPDALVYLTDGFGSFPSDAPKYPVIWGSITPKGGVSYPFGDVVEIPKQA